MTEIFLKMAQMSDTYLHASQPVVAPLMEQEATAQVASTVTMATVEIEGFYRNTVGGAYCKKYGIYLYFCCILF